MYTLSVNIFINECEVGIVIDDDGGRFAKESVVENRLRRAPALIKDAEEAS